jgi:predicted DNA-binding transcriptional regulator AlpA
LKYTGSSRILVERSGPNRPAAKKDKKMDSTILSAAEAARRLGVSVATLQKWRQRPRQPLPFVRISARKIGYCASDIAAFVEARRFVSTKEYCAAPKA